MTAKEPTPIYQAIGQLVLDDTAKVLSEHKTEAAAFAAAIQFIKAHPGQSCAWVEEKEVKS